MDSKLGKLEVKLIKGCPRDAGLKTSVSMNEQVLRICYKEFYDV